MNVSKHQRNLVVAFFLIVLASLFFTLGCQSGPPEPLSVTRLDWLGTTSTITVYDGRNQAAIDAAFQRVAEIHYRMSLQLTTSEISQINAQAGLRPVKVSPDTFFVIQEGLRIGHETQGAFDITIGPIVNLWDITGDPYFPSQEEIDKLLPLVNFSLVEIRPETFEVFLPIPGMKIDLGAIAKGFAADEAARILIDRGVRKAIVDFGGDIIAIGTRVTEEPWRIGIQNPFLQRGNLMGIFLAEDQTVVTSGTYERYIMENGVLYHHIFDPATGFSARNGIESVTIMASGPSTLADAYSTAVFVMGLEPGLAYINSVPEVETLIIMDDGSIHRSQGLIEKGDGAFRLLDQNFRFAR